MCHISCHTSSKNKKLGRLCLPSQLMSLFQDLNLMDNPIYSHRRKLLLDNLCLLACPYISYGYCVNHSRLRCRMRPFRRIIICDIKIYIPLDTWDLPTARVLPSRYVSVNIGLVSRPESHWRGLRYDQSPPPGRHSRGRSVHKM